MSNFIIQRAQGFSGRIRVPGDKSISHRALIFGSLAQGPTEVHGLLDSGDVRSTRECLERLGVESSFRSDRTLEIRGKGPRGFRKAQGSLDCGNSGTTMRVLMGMLCGQDFGTRLVGDESLSRRPMARVADPLKKMGAKITTQAGGLAPIEVQAARLHGAQIELGVASAQVKTAILIAGLLAEGQTIIRGSLESRDHTERLFPHFGVGFERLADGLSIRGGQLPHGAKVEVPGDPSSAAFWIAAAALVPGADLTIEGVSLNPTRVGFLKALERMGAELELEVIAHDPEPFGNVHLRSARGLQGIQITAAEVPSMIDELPLLAVVASQAEGRTEVRGAAELRVKESDRIEMVAQNLRAMGARIETFEDGFAIQGPQKLYGAKLPSGGDHRIAMAFAIAGLVADGTTEILEADCVGISYPEFHDTMKGLVR